VTSKTSIQWTGGMQFDANVNGHQLILDTTPEFGGNEKGTSPKPLLLTSLAGCTGMDVVSLLVKMRVENYQLRIDVEGEQTEDYPVIYHTIHLHYYFTGNNVPKNFILRAIELSQTRYCGVYAMLSKSSRILTKVFINDKEIA
jgi:putative redox protein